ncbi:hypothetical protein BDV18DRAFT_159922 [Aspergillus unguis]
MSSSSDQNLPCLEDLIFGSPPGFDELSASASSVQNTSDSETDSLSSSSPSLSSSASSPSAAPIAQPPHISLSTLHVSQIEPAPSAVNTNHHESTEEDDSESESRDQERSSAPEIAAQDGRSCDRCRKMSEDYRDAYKSLRKLEHLAIVGDYAGMVVKTVLEGLKTRDKGAWNELRGSAIGLWNVLRVEKENELIDKVYGRHIRGVLDDLERKDARLKLDLETVQLAAELYTKRCQTFHTQASGSSTGKIGETMISDISRLSKRHQKDPKYLGMMGFYLAVANWRERHKDKGAGQQQE